MKANSHIHFFSVKIEHTYFNNNVCSCLYIKPSISTEQIIRRFGFRLIKDQNISKFYGKSAGSIEESLKYIQNVSGEESFDFDIVAEHSNFNIITDFPLNWKGAISYNTASGSNVLSEGAMELKADFEGKVKSTATAYLTVQFADIVKLDQADSGAEFTIHFNSRSTRWNYFIINKNSVQLDNPKITGKEEIQFEGPVNTNLENGQEAIKFTSGDRMLPLSEVPFYKFKLINENLSNKNVMKQSSGKVVLDGLPNPSPNKIGIEQTADKNVATSDMYVYV